MGGGKERGAGACHWTKAGEGRIFCKLLMTFNALFAQIGVKNLFGQYEDGILTGKGKVMMNDDSVREGWFQHGFFHGPARYILLCITCY